MRSVCGAFSLLFVLIADNAIAQDKPEDVVKAAIVAAGGAEKLSKYPAGRVVGKGTMIFAGAETAFTFEQGYHTPGRFRTVISCEVKGEKWELVQAVDGAVARQTINRRVIPLGESGIRELQLGVLLNEVGQLSPLIADRRFVVKPDKQLRGPDAIGLVVQVKNYPELRLAFDRKTNHLVRIGYRDTDPETAKEAEMEITFADFKEESGVVRPSRSVVTRDGRKVAELIVEKFTPLEKIDPTAFKLDD